MSLKENDIYNEFMLEAKEENRLCSQEACIFQSEEPLTEAEQEHALKNFKL